MYRPRTAELYRRTPGRGRNARFDGICGRNAIGGLQDKRKVLCELPIA